MKGNHTNSPLAGFVAPSVGRMLVGMNHCVQSLLVFLSFVVKPTATMADLGAQLNQLTPEQRQMVLARAQQEANQQVMQGT